ncbi:hypothetical protein SAMN05444266_106353 [Chitinophaga jiangningensis]|uniref:Uncharacterized protein n=1 Tax=Chitinophaga jiangningensis TaxID=1419482 RepID=A0A1M7G0H8_9BACT|nr:hypothetical protein [Chitinophaga jiangningensis]SHM09791.1 hypothetical protein SAMN05444266_106353 [Chitinophaga jiangningensis]
MAFDDLQSLWNSDKSGDSIAIPANLEKLKSAQLPVDKFRRRLKKEFFAQLAAVIFLGFVPAIMTFNAYLLFAFYLMYFNFVLICGYFFIKFYLFYKNMSNTALTSKDNLYAVYYDIKLSNEFYKVFSYCLLPFVIVFVGIILINDKNISPTAILNKSAAISQSKVFTIVGLLLLVIVLMVAKTEIYVHVVYGKYAQQIKKLLDEFREV